MKKKKMVSLWLLLTLILLMGKAGTADAEEVPGIEAYVGTYLCDLPEYEEYSNPEVLSLYFNENGMLERCHRMFFATIGSTRYYEYSDYTLNGNILTCEYSNVHDEYGDTAVTPSSHCFILTEEGNLVEGNHVWYRTGGTSDTFVCIKINGEEYGIYPLAADQEIKIAETNICKIESGTCRMTEADCPKQICISQGIIQKEGEMIVCLPNRVIIEIISDHETANDGEIDAVTW